MFVRSIDASPFMKTREKTFELLDAFVDQIREADVVQVVSDNRSNYVLARKLLKAKGQICIGLHVLHIALTLYWRTLEKFLELQKLWKDPFN